MFNAGMVRPGSTVYIPINTFDSNDPSASVTATTWLNTDCHVHKDGGTTQRASSAGETLSIDFDTVTGNHLLSIDTSDNTTANFYEAGSTYHVRIEGVTVDAGNVNAWIGCFSIGYEGALVNTTMATRASATSFTLEDGSTDDDAYNGCPVVIHNLASAFDMVVGYISDYTGATKTVTLQADPGVITSAAGDHLSIMPPVNVNAWNAILLSTTNPLPNAAADAAGGLPISDAGGLDLDAKLAATNEVTAARMGALTDWIDGGRLDLLLDAVATTADLLDKVGAVDEAAAAGDPSATESVMQYVKQIVNILTGTTGITTMPAAAAPANNVSIAEMVRAIYDDTNSLDGTKIPDTISLAAINAEADTAITDAALATAADLLDKVGAVNEAAAAGDPSATESVMQYVKQIVNILVGTAGVATYPAAAAPGNAVSLAEIIRAIYDDSNSLDGTKIPDTLSLANINAEVDTAFTTQMADSVPADGTISTREQALYAILQMLTEFAISGTTMTVRKVDGTTALMTFTLDDGTNPTSLTRAT